MADKDDPDREIDVRGAKGVQIGDNNLQINVHAAARPKAWSAYHHQVRAIAPDDGASPLGGDTLIAGSVGSVARSDQGVTREQLQP